MGHDEFVFHAYRWAWSLDLPSSTKLVLLALCDHVNRDDRSCHPSWVGIEKMTGLARRTVARAISALVDDGVISTDPRPGKTNRYLLNLPSDPCHHDTGRGATVAPVEPDPCHHGTGSSATMARVEPDPCHHGTGSSATMARVEPDPCHHGTGTRATVAPKDIYKNKTPYRGGGSNTAVTIPDDWQPSEAVLERIKAAGLPTPTPQVVLHFVSHYQAKRVQNVDWDPLFLTWCAREQRFATENPTPARTTNGARSRRESASNDDWIGRGQRVGVTAKPGESWEQFTSRVRAAEARALS